MKSKLKNTKPRKQQTEESAAMYNNLSIACLVVSCAWYGVDNLGKSTSSSVIQEHDKVIPEEYYETSTYIKAPETFEANAVGNNWAILSWSSNADKSKLNGFQIYRNNILLTELTKNQFSFKDTFLQHNQNYQYDIYAINKDGWKSDKVTLNTKTKENAKPDFTPSTSNAIIAKSNIDIGSELYHFTAKDLDGDDIYFQISGKDADFFLINENDGKLINRKFLRSESHYEIVVSISDGMNKNQLDVLINTQR